MKQQDFLSSIWVRPVNENGEELSSEGLHRWARRWMYELSRRAKTDSNAKQLLINFAVEAAESAISVSDNNAFIAHAKKFCEALKGKQPSQSNPFCEEWLLVGLMHAEGLKTSWHIREPNEMAKLAISALRFMLGEQWQDHNDVTRHFNVRGHRYATKEGPKTWSEMRNGERREHVRKTLRTAARTWKRQTSG
jgi:hypothetical protein